MTVEQVYICDQCDVETRETPHIFRLAQTTGEYEEDDDEQPQVLSYDLCSIACLHAWATDVLLDFEDNYHPETTAT